MLRIQRSANGEVIFKLSGRLDEEHIAELETMIGAEQEARPIVLDLKDMTLTGEEGITFLARCKANNVTLLNCNPYVREWIARQRKGR
jgi:anti-anti-sigma regulatory factor